jgi:hypothetical protein
MARLLSPFKTICEPTIAVSKSIVGIDPDRLGKLSDLLIVVVLVAISDAPTVEGVKVRLTLLVDHDLYYWLYTNCFTVIGNSTIVSFLERNASPQLL